MTLVVDSMLAAGCAPDLIDMDNETGLMVASRYGHIYILESLLSQNASTSEQDKDGWTALMYAANSN